MIAQLPVNVHALSLGPGSLVDGGRKGVGDRRHIGASNGGDESVEMFVEMFGMNPMGGR
jgi:hypothetical protein